MVTVFSRESIKDQEIDRLGHDLGIALKRAEAAEAELAKAQQETADLRVNLASADDIIAELRAEIASVMARDAILPALRRPGMYAGEQGERSSDAWRADAVVV